MFFRSLKKWKAISAVLVVLVSSTFVNTDTALAKKDDKKVILYVPQDDRPISSEQTAQVIRSLGYKVEMPPDKILGDRNRAGRPEEINRWLMENGGKDKVAVISSDAMIYGSLVASRKHHIPKDLLVRRVNNIDKLHQEYPKMPIYMFTSIMRTPKDGASSGTEEPDYYVEYGKAIANYTRIDSADTSQLNQSYQVALRDTSGEIALKDWLTRRKTNLQVSGELMNLVKNGSVEYMVMGRDDNDKYSQTHKESVQIENYAKQLGLTNDKFEVLTGLDEIGLLLLTRVVNKLDNYNPYVYVKYASGYGGATVPSYSDEMIDNTITDQIRVAGATKTYDVKKADLIMMVNTNQSGWTYDANTPVNTLQPRNNTMAFVKDIENYVDKGEHVSLADIAFANGSDNALMNELQKRALLEKLYGYAGWNTATNSTGFALGMGLVGNRIDANKRDELLLTRYLDDWVYQANIRQNVNSYLNILPGIGDYLTIGDYKLNYAEEYGTKLMRNFATDNLGSSFAEAVNVSITMPWNRIFEANIDLTVDPNRDSVLRKHLKMVNN